MMVKTVVDRILDSRIQILVLDQPWTIVLTPIQLSELWIEDFQPHEYFLHSFGKEFLDVFIVEINLLEGKILSKGHLGSYSWLETYQSWRTFSMFWLNI